MNADIKYYEGKRSDLIKFIPDRASHILDVGCGLGMMGKAIKENRKGFIEVVGIEKDPTIGAKAKENIDDVLVGNVEEIKLPYKTQYFDCIVYGDVLEHLIDPWSLLIRHAEFLKPGGYMIASIPNIAHYRTVKMLRKKEWNYQESGILDKSHIRFFTLKTMKDMFNSAGLKVVNVERKIGASKIKKILNTIFFNRFLDSLTEQYIVVAKK